ncbi:hypothetical protein C8R43DRAFT_1240951 [Mycena crocata]|nr:hypothetical protein C8R43DRAFT_1240951 [Mycena crocata]
MSAPSVPQSEPFPIGAVVAAGMFVVIFTAIIVVFALAQKHWCRKPTGSVEEGQAANHRPGVPALILPDPELQSRADGSTIYISTPTPVREPEIWAEHRTVHLDRPDLTEPWTGAAVASRLNRAGVID